MAGRRGKQFGVTRNQAGNDLRNEGYLPGVLDVGQPDLSELTFRALQLKGALPAHLDRQIQLGLTVEDFTRPEFWWLRRGQLGYWPVNLPAVAGQLGTATIQGASGVLAVVERVIISNPAAAARSFLVGLSTALPGAGGVGQGLSRDTRSPSGTNCAVLGQAKAFAAPVTPTGNWLLTIQAGDTIILEPNAVLSGTGAFYTVQALTVNEVLACQLEWRERVQLSSEQ